MAQTPKDKQPETPRRNWAGAVSRDALSLGGAAFTKAGFSDPALVLRWEEIVGPEIARIARPLKLSGGVLTLKAEPAAALFLQHESRILLDRINGWLGAPQLARLRFVQGPLADRPAKPRPAHGLTDAAADDPARGFAGAEGLKSALLRLAGARRPTSD